MFLGVPIFACVQELVKYLLDRRLHRRNMPTEAYAYVERARETAAEPASAPRNDTSEEHHD